MSAKEAASAAAVSPFYLIAGEDPFLRSQETRHLVDRLLSEEEKQVALWQPREEESGSILEILDELRTVPFLAKRRVVLIQDAEEFLSKHRSVLEGYLENPSPTGVLILTTAKADSRTRLAKLAAKLGGLIEVAQPKPWELPRFACAYCERHFGKRVAFPAAQLLVELVGEEPGRICSELEKLAVYAGEQPTITPEHVQSLAGSSRTFGAFDVIDSLMKNAPGEALRRLRAMFESDKSADYTVVGAFSYHFRRLFEAKALLEKGLSESAAARKVGVWEKMQERFFEQLRPFTLKQLGQVLGRLGEMDYLIKTGRSTAPAAIERFLIEIAAGL